MNAPTRTVVETVTEQDLRLLRIFRVVAEAGGLTAAEASLRMERSTISRHVQALEAKLGGALCVRGPSGFDLTDLGRSALRAAVTAEDMLAQVRDDLNRLNQVVTGDLKIGVADNCISNPEARLVDTLARYRSRAPTVRLHVSVKPPCDLVADVIAGRAHLAIIGAVYGAERLDSQFLFKEHFKLYVSRSRGSGTYRGEPHGVRLRPWSPATPTSAVFVSRKASAWSAGSWRRDSKQWRS